MANRKLVSLLVLAGATILLTSMAASQSPSAATVDAGSGQNDSASSSPTVTAQGGNVTSANITVDSITNKWSAFYGQLTATERLSDASGNNFYKWTVDNPTATGSWIYAVPTSNGAPTSLSNISDVNTFFSGLSGSFTSGADKASATFNSTQDMDGVTSAPVANTYVDGVGPSDTFSSGIVQDGSSNPVYLAEVQQDSTGFNGNANDFQLLVGVGESTSTQSYDFYAKIG